MLNGILQEYLNPPDAAKEEHPYGNGLFRVGDKVMQTKNNYQMEWEVVSKYGIPVDKGLGIFNGDMGVIKEINDFSQEMVVEFDERRRVSYPFHQLDEIELAYRGVSINLRGVNMRRLLCLCFPVRRCCATGICYIQG